MVPNPVQLIQLRLPVTGKGRPKPIRYSRKLLYDEKLIKFLQLQLFFYRNFSTLKKYDSLDAKILAVTI